MLRSKASGHYHHVFSDSFPPFKHNSQEHAHLVIYRFTLLLVKACPPKFKLLEIRNLAIFICVCTLIGRLGIIWFALMVGSSTRNGNYSWSWNVVDASRDDHRNFWPLCHHFLCDQVIHTFWSLVSLCVKVGNHCLSNRKVHENIWVIVGDIQMRNDVINILNSWLGNSSDESNIWLFTLFRVYC